MVHPEAAVKGIPFLLVSPPASCGSTACSLAVVTVKLAASSSSHSPHLTAQTCRLPCAQRLFFTFHVTLEACAYPHRLVTSGFAGCLKPCLNPACWPAGGTAATYVAGQDAVVVAGASAPGETQLTTVSLGDQSTATTYKVPLHADSFPQASEAATPITGVWASPDGAR